MPASDGCGRTNGPGEHTKQQSAFMELCDVDSSQLRIPLGGGAAREALAKLNRATQDSIHALSISIMYCIGSTMSQGACLLVAVLGMLGLLEPAWCGPPTPLAEHAVKTIQNFVGRAFSKVRPEHWSCCIMTLHALRPQPRRATRVNRVDACFFNCRHVKASSIKFGRRFVWSEMERAVGRAATQ